MIIGVLILAAALAGFNRWFQLQRTARPIRFWGAEPAGLISSAERIELLILGPPGEGPTVRVEPLVLDGRPWHVAEVRDAAQAPGLLNVRRSLIEDGSFDWEAPLDDCTPHWEFALRFRDGQRTATVLFAFDCKRLSLLESGRQVVTRMNEDALRGFFDDALQDSANLAD